MINSMCKFDSLEVRAENLANSQRSIDERDDCRVEARVIGEVLNIIKLYYYHQQLARNTP